jgi:hypothetical protein
MLDLAANFTAARQPERASQIVAALTQAEMRRLRLVRPWLFSDD